MVYTVLSHSPNNEEEERLVDSNLLAIISLLVFVGTLVIAIKLKLNIGIMAFAAAFVLGLFVVNGDGKIFSSTSTAKYLAKEVDFTIWLLVIGCSMMGNIAKMDGTLEKIGTGFCSLFRGNRKLYYFGVALLTSVTSWIGLGGAGILAVILPILAIISVQQGIPFVLLAAAYHLRNGYASFAYGQTPQVLLTQMEKAGIPFQLNGIVSHYTIIGFIISTINLIICFFIFGGHKLKKLPADQVVKFEKFTKGQYITLAGLLAYAAMCIGLQWAPGPSAILVTVVLCIIKKIDMTELIKKVPWNVVVMLGGTTTLLAVVKAAGGIDLVVSGIQAVIGNNGWLVTPLLMLCAGALSIVSSNSSVVIPTFVPIAGALAPLYGLSAEGLSTAVAYGGFSMGITPLSSTGAQYMGFYATVADDKQNKQLFIDLFKLGFVTLALNVLWGCLGLFQLFAV